MKLPVKARHMPVRIAVGTFVLASGIDKAKADEETASGLHGFAAGTYPPLRRIAPTPFVKALSAGEIALGAALLLPVVPTVVAGAALTAFSAGLLGLYLRTPGMRRDGSLMWTQNGLTVAKDVWMLGAGASLVVDALTDEER